MNNILLKILCGLSIVFTASISTRAATTDTTLIAGNGSPVGAITTKVIVPANITYPFNLQDHMEESLDYVEKYSNKKRDYLVHTWNVGKKYFPTIADVLKRYHLPEEFKVLIALESGFNANAVSRAGAVGYWQLMDDAAREYGLHIAGKAGKSKQKDDRKNFSRSTLAAVQYLSDRCKELGNDLLLIVAAYNCGDGKIRNAKKKSGKDNPSFWDIKKYLPSETKNYVLDFITLNLIFSNYDNFLSHKLTFAPQTKEITIYPEPVKTISSN